MSEIAIRVDGLGKRYRIGAQQERNDGHRFLQGGVGSPFHYLFSVLRQPPPMETIWALKDVTFEVKRGEIVGIVGRNGAGKSTLLKILSRITEPTEGCAEIRGRVGSLLEVGTGFHPELTGRENIYLNGTVLGMRRAEIDRKYEEIVEFAEIGRFLDTPVKRYSSGMYVRLAFAVAAHLEPEILLIDEVLAVGDALFQKKCIGKIGDVAKEGRTVLLVSHNMNAVRNLCSRALWLESGMCKYSGDPHSVVQAYLSDGRSFRETVEFDAERRGEDSGVTILKAALVPSGEILTNGMPLDVKFTVHLHKERECNFILYVYREGSLAFASADFHQPLATRPLRAGSEIEVSFRIPAYLLNPGLHSFGFSVVDKGGNFCQYANVQEVLPRRIDDDQLRRGGEYFLGWGGAVSPILPMAMKVVMD